MFLTDETVYNLTKREVKVLYYDKWKWLLIDKTASQVRPAVFRAWAKYFTLNISLNISSLTLSNSTVIIKPNSMVNTAKFHGKCHNMPSPLILVEDTKATQVFLNYLLEIPRSRQVFQLPLALNITSSIAEEIDSSRARYQMEVDDFFQISIHIDNER